MSIRCLLGYHDWSDEKVRVINTYEMHGHRIKASVMARVCKRCGGVK